MAATYPELFSAGTVYSGVSAGCFYSSSGGVDAWNSSCAEGQVISTPSVWASIAENMYPGYSGARPKMQIYHGSADTTLYPQNYYETCKQWAGVFGYNYNAPTSTQNNSPLSGYTRTIWGSNLQGIYATGVGHTVPIQGNEDMKWFGFTGSSTGSGGTTTTTGSIPSNTAGGGGSTGSVPEWGQCGGIGYSGPTTVSIFVCASWFCPTMLTYLCCDSVKVHTRAW